MKSKKRVSFTEETLAFLEELSRNNNREWFAANKQRYEKHVLDVALEFIQSMQAPLAEIAPHFTAVPRRMGGSLMRVYRDTRFSRNKAPYKTNIGIQFRHENARDVHAPGYYLHIDPGEVFLGVGTWRPEPAALAAIRRRIDEKRAEWLKARDDRKFRRYFELGGESLSRPPKGISKDHPLLDDLRRKDFIAVRNLETADPLQARFQQQVEAAFAAATPFMRFLCKAVGVPF
ncbi:MAG: DUF2461 domain-containing protein [Woeseiaceae bacterium]|nr:DUF2461 domain-containing protein [Woeseiaceae bacterium]